MDIAMLPLLARGTAALRVYTTSLPHADGMRRDMLLNTARGIHVVTRDDFVAHADLCLLHVDASDVPLHVLCADGALCILIEKRHGRW